MELRRRHFLAPVVVALSLSIADRASADDDLQRARALFDEAGELEKQGHWSAAQDRLRAALRIRETPHLHYALGWALENGGDAEEARSEYDLARRLAGPAGAPDVEKLSGQRIEALDREKARAKKSSTSVSAPRSEPSRGQTLPLVVIAGGGIAAVGGIALLVSSTSDVSTRDSNRQRWCELTACAGTVATLPESEDAALARREAVDASSRGNTKQVAGAILGSIGVVGIAVGTYLLLDGARREARAPAKTGRVSLDAVSLPGGAFGSATLAF
ncbi:MAG: hypothetical protein JST00_18740 [Deltaproteobacteria bacterium]|nr:hypothetical protein [Deltaproteobacteria bacterium]